jgi:hypothetical protein
MKKQLILLSFVSSMLLADTFINPLPNSVKATDNGGSKSAIDAYKDGIGAELMDKPGIATDNSAFNTLTLKYGEAAKANNVSVVDQVLHGNSNPTSTDLALATFLSSANPNGTACNDGNSQTVNDIYMNGICAGTPSVYLDPNFKGNVVTLSNNNLTASYNGYTGSNVRANIGKTTGKWYWEVTVSAISATSCVNIGVLQESANIQSTYFYAIAGAIRLPCYSASGTYPVNLDLDSKTITANGVTHTLGTGIKYFPAAGDDNTRGGITTLNFNFNGPFVYSVPAGYSKLQ